MRFLRALGRLIITVLIIIAIAIIIGAIYHYGNIH
jgi:hypothetical protein